MNVTCLTDTGGDEVERYVYNPYGEAETVYSDDWSTSVAWAASKKNNIRFAGYYFDNETGLYHVRNRMYHPNLGLWLQRDPLGYVDGMSLYEYCRSRALGAVDPTGLGLEIEGTPDFAKEMMNLVNEVYKLDPDLKRLIDKIAKDDNTLTIKQSEPIVIPAVVVDGKELYPEIVIPKGTAVIPDKSSPDWPEQFETTGVDATLEWQVDANTNTADDLASLAHDLQHGLDFVQGNVPADPTTASGAKEFPNSTEAGGGQAVSVIEPAAVRTENIVREQQNRPLRENYEDFPIPNPEPSFSPLRGGPTPKEEFGT